MAETHFAEGYIKFCQLRTPVEILVEQSLLEEFNRCRSQLKEHRMIGITAEGIGFGNLSVRFRGSGEFLISGSATGGLDWLTAEKLAEVFKTDIAANTVWCRGLTDASAETMSHAVIYRHSEAIGAVVHVHHRQLWEATLCRLPSTPGWVAYGTPEMSEAIADLLQQGNFRDEGVIHMGGHRDGLIAFAATCDRATLLLISLLSEYNL